MRQQPRSTQGRSSAASDVYKSQGLTSARFNSARLLGPALAGLLIAGFGGGVGGTGWVTPVSYIHPRAHETVQDLEGRLPCVK